MKRVKAPRYLRMLLKAGRQLDRRAPFRLAAALSYYTLLSLAPIVLLTVSLAGLIFGRAAVEGQLVAEMRALIGEPAAELAELILRNTGDPGTSQLSLIIGGVILLVGATTVFVQLQQAMNEIFNVEARPSERGGFAHLVRKRLLSLGMVLALGFLLLVSLLLSAALSALSEWISSSTRLGEAVPLLLHLGDVLVSLLVVAALLALMFRYLPDVELAWRDVRFGAFVTAALLTAGKFLIGLYLGRTSVGSTYGAAGSVVVFLVWVYYAAVILLYGAALTEVQAEERRHRQPKPEPHAVRLEPGEAAHR